MVRAATRWHRNEAVARQCTGQRPIQLANGPGRLKPERAATNANQTPHPVAQPDAPPIEAPPASYQRKQIETAAVRRPSVVVRTNTTNAGLPTPREGRVPKLPPSAVSNAPDYLVVHVLAKQDKAFLRDEGSWSLRS